MKKNLVTLSFLLLMAGAICSPLVLSPSRAQDSSPYARFLLPRASDPTPAREGQLYANTTSHAPKYYNGSAWVTLQTAGASGASYGLLLGGQPTSGTSVTNATVFGAFGAFGTSTNPNTWSSTESQRQMLVPVAATFSNMCFNASAVPVGASVQVTFRDNGADTALTFTIAAAAATGIYCDSTHTVSVSAGHLVDYKIVSTDSVNPFGATQWSVAYR